MIYLNQKIILCSVVQNVNSSLQSNSIEIKEENAGGTLEPSAAVATEMLKLVELRDCGS